MMFTVYEKSSDKAVKVYNVRHDKSGYPHFLIYEDGQWKYKSAKHYKPIMHYDEFKDIPIDNLKS